MSTSTARLKLLTVDKGLRFEVATGKVTFTLESGTDAALPNPVQAVLGATGGCSGMDVISILRKQRQQVTGYEIEITAERREEHPRAFTRIDILHRVRGHDVSPAAVEEAIRLSDTKYCSVHAMLAPAVTMTSRFEILPAELEGASS
jgi:putative redox protein